MHFEYLLLFVICDRANNTEYTALRENMPVKTRILSLH